MRAHGEGEEGQILPALLQLVVVLLFAGFVIFQVGRATVVQASATTAADAAALAAGYDLQEQLQEILIRRTTPGATAAASRTSTSSWTPSRSRSGCGW